MPPVYTNITKQEMDAVLLKQGFEVVNIPHVYEYVYVKHIANMQLRVFSSISLYDNHGRDVGKDAIRVVVLDTSNSKVKYGEKRINRTQNWKINLQERLNNWKDIVPEWCDWCGAPMLRRKRHVDDHPFWGCSRFPKCKRVHNIEI